MPDKENNTPNFHAKIKIAPANVSRRATTSGGEFVDLFHASLAQAGQAKDRNETRRVPKDIRERAQNLDELMSKSLSENPKLLKEFIADPLRVFEKIAGKQEPEFLRTVKTLRRTAEKQTAQKAAVNELKPGEIEVSFGPVKHRPRRPLDPKNSNRKGRT